MSAYGYYPTDYSGKSDMELYAQFRRETWKELDESSRQQLLQEVVNRAALENGEKGSCQVVFEDLEPGLAGTQYNGMITLNREMYVNDRQAVSYKGRTVVREHTASNLDALNTVLHEDQHAYQAQLLDGTIQPRDFAQIQQIQEYKSNNFTKVTLPQPDGSVKDGSTYLQGETEKAGYYLYYFQSTERDAHLVAEQKTLAIISDLEAKYGTEPSFQEYREEVAATGYQATLSEAQRLFLNPAAEKEINRSLMNHYYSEHNPVDPRIETAVRAEMEASYAVQNGLDISGKITAGTGMEEAAVSPKIEEPAASPKIEEPAASPRMEESAAGIDTASHAASGSVSNHGASGGISSGPGVEDGGGIEDEGGIE